MTRRLLQMAFPLALLNALPSAGVLAERLLLARTPDGPAAVAAHAVLLSAATLLLLFLGGPSVHAVLILGRAYAAGDVTKVSSATQSTIRVASLSGLLCLLLLPIAGIITAVVSNHSPDESEVAFAQGLLLAAPLQLLLQAALAPALARGRMWVAVKVVGAGAATQLAVSLFALPIFGLGGTALARVIGGAVSLSLAVRTHHNPTSFLAACFRRSADRDTHLALLRRGSAAGVHAALSFVTVVYFFYAAMARTGEGPLAAAALALSSYGVLSTFPFAVAQTTAMLAARAADDPREAGGVTTEGERLTRTFAFAVAASLHAAGWVVWLSSGLGPVSPHALAFLGASVHASLDCPIQSQVWALRACGKERLVSAAMLAAGGLFAATLFLPADAPVRWLTLILFDVVLFVVFRRILMRCRPKSAPTGECTCSGGGLRPRERHGTPARSALRPASSPITRRSFDGGISSTPAPGAIGGR